MEQFRDIDIESRIQTSKKFLKKFPNRIPVLVKPGNGVTPAIDNYKYLVPANLKVSEFVHIIRERVKLNSTKAMFLFVNNTLPPNSSTMREIYEQHADQDGFLYVTYSLENTFGSNFTFKIFEFIE